MGLPVQRALSLTLATAMLAGCGKSGSESDPSQPSSRGGSMELREVAADKLPPVGAYLPAMLDEGRLEVAPPEGWEIPSRSAQHVVVFLLTRTSELPRITIDSEPAPAGAADLTADGVTSYAAEVQSKLEAADRALLEPVLPMVIGNTPYARYVTGVRLQSKSGAALSAERQTLETIRNGRHYTIELDVPRDNLPKYRDAAYAVAAALRFQAAAASPEPTTPAESPAAPAAEKSE